MDDNNKNDTDTAVAYEAGANNTAGLDTDPEVTDELRNAWDNLGESDESQDTTPSGAVADGDKTEESAADSSDGDSKPETEASGDATESQGTEVPERLVQAGRRAKMSDEVIVTLATSNPEALESLAKAQDDLSAGFGELGRQRQETITKPIAPTDADKEALYEPLKLDLDDAEFDEDTKTKVIAPLTDKINQLTTELKRRDEAETNGAQAQQSDVTRTIDHCFDQRTEKHPELGASASLTPEQQERRFDILGLAEQKANRWNAAHPEDQLSLDRAVDMALSITTNSNATEQEIVTRLNNRTKLFTTRPTSGNKNAPVQKEGDKQISDIKAFAEEHGIDNLK